MASLFLSYAREDQERVSDLAGALERAGHQVWWDRRITGGAEFEREIEQALADAEIVVVAWSATSAKSHWVRDEAATGRDRMRRGPSLWRPQTARELPRSDPLASENHQ